MAGMSKYLANRLVQGFITLFIVTSLIFVLFDLMPGDPLDRFRANPLTPPERLRELTHQYGLDKPYAERYGTFVWNMFTMQFGQSWSENRPVIDILMERMPRTLLLFGVETLVVFALGIKIGSYIAWKRGGPVEGTTVVTSLVFYNMPSFWIGLISIWIFSFKLGLFPLSGFSGPDETVAMFHIPPDAFYFGFVDYLWHMMLPLAVLVAIGIAGVILLMRTSLLEVMGEDYILTAKAKGLSERLVRVRHANRNAYLPIMTSFTISMALAVGGALILEQIFTYKGIGWTYLAALLNQDQFLAGATLFILSVLVIGANILADIMYAWLDPRVRI